MQRKTNAFTLIEVIVSITLLSFVLLALYKSADILRKSNQHLFTYLEKSINTTKGTRTLYMDLMHADHNVTINSEDKFHRLIIEHTTNSLYGQGEAKVVWLVHKNENTLLRIEGGKYEIPLKLEENVEIDVVAKNVEIFKIYKSKKKDKILAMLQIKGEEPQIFMSQTLPLAPPKPKKKRLNSKTPKAIQ